MLAFAAAARAQLRFEPASVDFGRRPQNEVFKAEIGVVNKGAVAVDINDIRGTCSCVTGEVAVRKLQPGKRTALTVRMESRQWEGLVRQMLMVATSDGGSFALPVSMDVYRYANWRITPSRLVLPPSARGAGSAAELRIEFTGNGPPKAPVVTADSPWIRVAPVSAAGAVFAFSVCKAPSAPGGSVYADLRIATGDPVNPIIDVPVFAYVTSNVRVTPEVAILPAVKAGGTATMNLAVAGWDGVHPPRLELDGGSARIASGSGADYVLEIAVRTDAPGASTRHLRLFDGNELVKDVPVLVRAVQ